MFGGAAWVLFYKQPGRDFEVYNDYNHQLANLYRCVQEHPDELIESLRYVINSRENFEWAKEALDRDVPASPVQKASWFYQKIRYSYASGLVSFGAKPHDMWSNFPLILQANRRLKHVGVENQDFEELIRHFDSAASFFYCDPPYLSTESYYRDIGVEGFTEKDHVRLRDRLMSMEGKFLLSYNDDAFVRELYDVPGIQMEAVTRLNNIKQRYDPNCQFAELLIANYDMNERSLSLPEQLELF